MKTFLSLLCLFAAGSFCPGVYSTISRVKNATTPFEYMRELYYELNETTAEDVHPPTLTDVWCFKDRGNYVWIYYIYTHTHTEIKCFNKLERKYISKHKFYTSSCFSHLQMLSKKHFAKINKHVSAPHPLTTSSNGLYLWKLCQ